MRSWTSFVEAVHVSTLSALVGIVALDPLAGMRSAPDWSGWLTGQQRLDRVMSRVAPPLFLSALAGAAGATLASLGHRPHLAATARAVATSCIRAAVAVTFKVNEPMNSRLRSWRPDDVPPNDWRAVRARWDQGHRWRRSLIAAAAGAAACGMRLTH